MFFKVNRPPGRHRRALDVPHTVARPRTGQSDNGVSAPSHHLEPKLRGGTELVLVADEDVMVRLAAARVLGRAGYRIITAGNGAEALALARAQIHLDLVLIDAVAPGSPEAGALNEIRALHPKVKTIQMGRHAQGRAEPSLGTSFLVKPFTAAVLQDVVRCTLDGDALSQRSSSG